MNKFLVMVALGSGILAISFWVKNRRLRRENFIRHTEFPKGLFDKLMKRHPQLSLKDCQLVAQGLRVFFLAHLKSGRKFVSMPSQVVDDLWHEFILYTRHYELFCQQAFGRFLHHTPAVVLSRNKAKNEGLRRSWWFACREENIDPRSPRRLPLLFALDAKLNVANGFIYVPDCSGFRRTDQDSDTCVNFAVDFASDLFDGGTAGFGDCGSDGGGDGCGDGGDGGGCGGD